MTIDSFCFSLSVEIGFVLSLFIVLLLLVVGVASVGDGLIACLVGNKPKDPHPTQILFLLVYSTLPKDFGLSRLRYLLDPNPRHNIRSSCANCSDNLNCLHIFCQLFQLHSKTIESVEKCLWTSSNVNILFSAGIPTVLLSTIKVYWASPIEKINPH